FNDMQNFFFEFIAAKRKKLHHQHVILVILQKLLNDMFTRRPDFRQGVLLKGVVQLVRGFVHEQWRELMMVKSRMLNGSMGFGAALNKVHFGLLQQLFADGEAACKMTDAQQVLTVKKCSSGTHLKAFK